MCVCVICVCERPAAQSSRLQEDVFVCICQCVFVRVYVCMQVCLRPAAMFTLLQ